MVYSEQQYKILEEKIKKLEKENELKDKDNKLLKKQLREKDEVIHDLDKNNYLCFFCRVLSKKRRKCRIEKKTSRIRKQIQSCENQLRKRQQ